MAAGVVSVLVEDFLPTLSEGIVKLGPPYGVATRLRTIHNLLFSVLAALPEVENKLGHSLELQEWLRKFKSAVYDAEDLLEELSMDASLFRPGKREAHNAFRPVAKLFFRLKMLGKLRDVVDNFRLIGSDPTSFIGNEISELHEACAIPIIGRTFEKEQIWRFLRDGGTEGDLPVLVVQGPSGCGKSSLVREAISEFYRGSRRFDVRIWVNASPPFDENRMTREIIDSLSLSSDAPEADEVKERLTHRVADLLDPRKRYLFILDDLPFGRMEMGRWLRFKRSLAGGGERIAILATTRDNVKISKSISLKVLGTESRALILATAFKEMKKMPDTERLRIADQLAAKCNGIPLITRVVGCYLSVLHTADNWSHFCKMLHVQDRDSVFSSLLYGGYPYGHFSSTVKRYVDLPPRVKQCFGLCSLFPRGHMIDKQTVAELWIALGYIKPSNADPRQLEDIADDYFHRLIQGRLFQAKELDIFGKVRSIVLHQDTEDLACSVAGWECGAHRSDNARWMILGYQKARHLSIMTDSESWSSDFLVEIQGSSMLGKLRTLLHFLEEVGEYEAFWHHIIPLLKRTRVLDLHRMNIVRVPKGVWKLKHLNYLDLSGNSKLEILPPAITGLLNLQTLKLSGCSSLKGLPPDMRKMLALRHLYINGCWKLTRMPRGLCDLKSLSILTDFILPMDDTSSAASSDLADLCKLENLRGSLMITNLGCHEDEHTQDGMEGLLEKKSYLESVELSFMNLPTDISLLEKLCPHSNLKGLKINNYGSAVFPEWMTRLSTHLPNLVEIALICCENCEHLPQFGLLPNLMTLRLEGLPDFVSMESGMGQSPPNGDNNAHPFSNLSSLCIRDCPKLNSLPMFPCLVKLTLVNVSEELFWHPCRLTSLKKLFLENIELLHHLPEEWLRELARLKELHVSNCPSLVSLSQGMRHLENLELLSIWNCKDLDLSKDEQSNAMMELRDTLSLKFLTIYKASKMELLPEWLSRAHNLRFLCIRSCPRLVALPEWVGTRESIKLIELVHCPRLTSLPRRMYGFTNNYPSKLNVVGCPFLKCGRIEHSPRL